MALDMATFAAALKQHYVDITVKNLVYKDNAMHALMSKDEKFGGLNLPLPLIYGNPQGRSATFANALAQKTNSQVKAFTLVRKHDYSLANIDNEVMEASQGDSDAFMRAATTEIDGAIQAAARSLAISEYRSGSGSIGQISLLSNVATPTITLQNIQEITNFEVGMTLNASSADGSGLRAGSVVILGVDRDLGTITVTGNWNAGIGAIADGDYLLVAGDFNQKISGLSGWIPNVAPSATLFLGVDRTSDTTRLAGVRKNVIGAPIEEALIDVAARIGREGGHSDHCFLDFENYANLEKALGSKVQYIELKGAEGLKDIAFEGIRIIGPRGKINVVPDQNAQPDRFFMLQLDTWKLYSLGMAPKLLKSDGMEFLRVSSADAVEVRVGYYAEQGCVAPGWNGVGILA